MARKMDLNDNAFNEEFGSRAKAGTKGIERKKAKMTLSKLPDGRYFLIDKSNLLFLGSDISEVPQ